MIKPTPANQKEFKIGLALGGGGPLSGIYEIGALRALDECLDGINFNDIDVYVGVSSGALIAANLANQITTAQMCRIFIINEPHGHPFHPQVFFQPAFKEYAKGLLKIPSIISKKVAHMLSRPGDQSILEAFTALIEALPNGVFSNEVLAEYLSVLYDGHGRTDDFRELRRKLFLVAADLDSGDAVRFGEEGYDHIPISKAVQASVACPGFYTPVEIEGHYYADGTLLKAMHASVALDQGADLVIGLNPLVPIDTEAASDCGSMESKSLRDGGLTAVLGQTLRTFIHSRVELGMSAYEEQYPSSDIVLVQPRRDDATMLLSSVFSFEGRQKVCEHAYQMTRQDLLERYDELAPIFERYGIKLNKSVLEDAGRSFQDKLYGTFGYHSSEQMGMIRQLYNWIAG
ncbi:patatin-like phospholipase family protein [Litoribrevibacter albus]|uniref:Patatin n=1 Tax=Litoribrevibacter albus TaxID=1473156 RepID=A0AA37W9H2_9GAMM|nr:patatin-like phospholipase family protein [Litoribrevibacter albus]GLQ33478.1 patatin [Litoribrevibacter albus]